MLLFAPLFHRLLTNHRRAAGKNTACRGARLPVDADLVDRFGGFVCGGCCHRWCGFGSGRWRFHLPPFPVGHLHTMGVNGALGGSLPTSA